MSRGHFIVDGGAGLHWDSVCVVKDFGFFLVRMGQLYESEISLGVSLFGKGPRGVRFGR